MAKIGIFPGVFDPVHNGHIAFALAAQKAADLDAVYLVPEANPWHKTNVTPLQHRMAMLRIATTGHHGVQPLRMGIERFTVAGMIDELDRHFKTTEFYLLVGSDVARSSLPNWLDSAKLLDAMSLVIGLRTPDINHQMQLQQMYTSALIISTNAPDDRSTIVRQGHHPHPQIAAYISSNQLYA